MLKEKMISRLTLHRCKHDAEMQVLDFLIDPLAELIGLDFSEVQILIKQAESGTRWRQNQPSWLLSPNEVDGLFSILLLGEVPVARSEIKGCLLYTF